jgi:hypothetical protein
MKRIFIFLIFVINVVACKQPGKKTTETQSAAKETPDLKAALEDSANFTTIYWLDSSFQDLGKVEEGQVVEVAFRFKNSGDKPLIIVNVSAGCGCTTISEKPETPLAPGQNGIIKAKFDSKNMAGERRKEVFVSSNTKGKTSHILIFRVEVVKT